MSGKNNGKSSTGLLKNQPVFIFIILRSENFSAGFFDEAV